MSLTPVLPDVNLLLAYGWHSHSKHEQCRSWLDSHTSFFTCPITELGFLRVSMSPGYRASMADVMSVLNSITQKDNSRFIHCEVPVSTIEKIMSYKETTDAYLVELSKAHSCKLATLDKALVNSIWAKDIAYNPFCE